MQPADTKTSLDNPTTNPADTQRRLIGYLKRQKGVLISGLLCAAGNAAVTGLLAVAIKLAIRDMVAGEVGKLNFICIMVVLVMAGKGLVSYGQAYFLSLASNRITTQLREEIFSHLHSLSLSFFNRRRTGAILSTLTNDVPVIQNATMSVRDIVAAPIVLIVSFGMMIYTSWRFTLFAFLFIPLMGFVIARIGKRMRRISDQTQIKLSDITTITEETVSGVRIIKSFSAEHHEIARFSAENERALTTVMKGVNKSAQLRPVLEFIVTLGMALVLVLHGN